MRNWSATYPDFVNSMRWGKCLNMISDDNRGTVVSYIDVEFKKYDWAFASFDFGWMFDEHYPIYIGDLSYDKLSEDGCALLEGDIFRLPYIECAFIFRFMARKSIPETVNLIHLKETDAGICGSIYFKQNHPRPRDLWTKAPAEFLLTNDGQAVLNFDQYLDLSGEISNEQIDECEMAYTRCICGIALLNSHRPAIKMIDDATIQLARINKSRSNSNNLTPIPATSVIRVDRPALAKLLERSAQMSASMRPHDRRGHYRYLSNGRKTWIRSTIVNGGSKMASSYKITS